MISFPIEQPVAIFLIVLAIILLGPLVFKPLRIPPIVGMIIAGIIVGPYGFNLLERDTSFRIFGEVGILYIMFLAAVEIDMFHLRKSTKKGLIFGLLSFSLPMAAGIIGSRYAFGVSWTTSVLIASMYASHTLISYPVISRFGLSNVRSVVIAVFGTIVSVLLALLTLAQVVSIRVHGGFEIGDLIRSGILMVLYMAAVGYSFPWLTRRFFSRNIDSISQYIFTLALVFVASLLAQIIGLEAILGAFYAGLVLNPMIPTRSGLMKNIKFVGNAIFIPYFLIGVGMLINVGVIFRGWNVAWAALNMTGIALFTKWLAAWVSSLFFGFDRTDRRLIFGLTSGKAAATIAATMIGFNYGLLTEDIMNGAVVMIFICCIVSTVVTERAAKKIRIRITAEDLSRAELVPGEYARQIVAVANPVTSEGIMRLALFMRAPENTNPVTALFVRSNDDSRTVEMGRNALRNAQSVADAMEVEIKTVERFDLGVVSGLTNVSREERATEMVIGFHRRANIVDSFFGAMTEKLLQSTDKMVIMSRCFIPVDTVERIVVAVPAKAEYETGFKLWVTRVANLGAQISARIIFIAFPETAEFIRTIIDDEGFEVRHDYRNMDTWEDFIILSSEIEEDDLMIVVGARKGSISYSSDQDSLPVFLGRHFGRHSLVVIYPRQF